MTLRNRLWLTPAVSALVVAVGLASPPPASSLPGVAPTADIAANPNPALVNQAVTFDGSGSTGDGLGGTVTDYRWDLDGDGSFETTTGTTSSVSQAYPAAATVNVSLQVTDNEGDTAEDTVSLKVHNPPTANFIFQPSSPAVGEQITFSSTSSDPDGPITHQWDLDNDGQFNDATGQSVTHAFASAGTMTVSLQVTDSDAAIATASHAVQVGGSGGSRAPEASFVLDPNSPRARSKVELTSTSSDPDGPIATHDWDLDGDEEFDDATGTVVETRFANKGKRAVGLRVTDGSGATDTETRTIRVRSRGLELMSPFPVVRLSGSVRPTGKTRIDRLTVRGPKGADVTVRCHGGGCPFDRRRRSVKKHRVGFPGIERLLTPRVVLEILVSKPNAIGKFTKFMMRDGKAPKRIDRCLRRERRKPIPCPR